MKEFTILMLIIAAIWVAENPQDAGRSLHVFVDAMENHNCPVAKRG